MLNQISKRKQKQPYMFIRKVQNVLDGAFLSCSQRFEQRHVIFHPKKSSKSLNILESREHGAIHELLKDSHSDLFGENLIRLPIDASNLEQNNDQVAATSLDAK